MVCSEIHYNNRKTSIIEDEIVKHVFGQGFSGPYRHPSTIIYTRGGLYFHVSPNRISILGLHMMDSTLEQYLFMGFTYPYTT